MDALRHPGSFMGRASGVSANSSLSTVHIDHSIITDSFAGSDTQQYTRRLSESATKTRHAQVKSFCPTSKLRYSLQSEQSLKRTTKVSGSGISPLPTLTATSNHTCNTHMPRLTTSFTGDYHHNCNTNASSKDTSDVGAADTTTLQVAESSSSIPAQSK